MPTRVEIARARRSVLKTGGRTKADLFVVDAGGERFVVKDFAHKSWWTRLIGRIQIARECRAYRWLGPRRGVVPFVGRVDAHALALEWIDGEQLGARPPADAGGDALLGRLEEIVAELHDAGVAHLDLRGRENVLVDGQGRLWVLDLASAVRLRPGGWAHRIAFPGLALADRAALLKWKGRLGAGDYTPEEAAFLRRFRFWRALWIFNRKRPTPKAGP